MQLIDKLAWLYLNDQRLLGARSRGKTLYYLPGGKREAGESDEAALLREVKEELTIDLMPATITYVGTFQAQADGKPPGTEVKMTCYQAEFTGTIQVAAEIAEVHWLTHQDKAHCSPVMQLILDWLKAHELIV